MRENNIQFYMLVACICVWLAVNMKPKKNHSHPLILILLIAGIIACGLGIYEAVMMLYELSQVPVAL